MNAVTFYLSGGVKWFMEKRDCMRQNELYPKKVNFVILVRLGREEGGYFMISATMVNG